MQTDYSKLLVKPAERVDLTDFEPDSTGCFKTKHHANMLTNAKSR
jgi:hypothetical protein